MINEKSKQDIGFIFFFAGILFTCLLDLISEERGLSSKSIAMVFVAIYLADKIVGIVQKKEKA